MLKRWKSLLALAWPLIVANSFWNLQLTIDRIFLGDFSTEALGAAMAVMGVFWVPMALLQGTANYVIAFVSQYVGAGKEREVGSALWQSIYVSLIGGVLFLGLILFSVPFFELVGHTPIVQTLEVAYFNSLTWSALPTALVASVSGYFTGLGRTRTVIGVNFVGLALNAVLDYLLIEGRMGFPRLGVAGAGYATALATYGAALFGCYLVFNKTNETTYGVLSKRALRWPLMRPFLKFGLPSGLQWALEGLAFTVFLIIMGNTAQGDAALAASSIAVTIMMLAVLPSMGVAQAVMTLVGQNIGEKNPEAARIATWDGVRISLIYMISVGTSFALFPHFYAGWFHNEENKMLWDQVSVLVPSILKIVAIFTLFDSAYLNISFALKGAGDTRFVSAMALLIPWPIMVLPAWLVRESESAVILAWSFGAVYAVTINLILVWRFWQGKWMTMSVIHEK